MTIAEPVRSRLRRVWRAAWPILVVVGGAVTCDSPTAPRAAQISIAPIIDLAGLSQFSGLVVDQARLTVIRPPAETLVRQTFPFSANLDTLAVNVSVTVTGTEQLNVIFELLAGPQLMFTGAQTVMATAGVPTPPQTPITPAFVGPGSQLASLLIAPRDSTVPPGASVPFTVTARDSANALVTSFYTSWTTGSTAYDIDANGIFRAGTTPGTVWVYAKTPTGIKDSTRISVAAPTAAGTMSLALPGNIVGVGTTGVLTVTLSKPAPAGGLTVSVTSDSTAYVTVAAPGTITIAAGTSAGTINLNGIATGLAIIRATAPGFTAALTGVAATPPIILLQPNVSVAAGASATVSIQLIPAPNVPTTVTLASTDVSKVTVTTTTVNFTAGQSNGSVTIQGVAAGTAGVTATATGYLQGASVVTVTSVAATPTTLQKSAGDNQTAFINDTTAVRLQARVLDGTGAPMSGITVQFAIASGGGLFGTASTVLAVTNGTGFATATAWKMGPVAGANTVTATVPGTPAVPAVTFTATGQNPPPVILLSVFGSTVVGQARTGQLQVKLLQAAPTGGVTVNLASTRAGLLRIGTYTSENGSASFAAGDTLKTVTVFGDSLVTGIDTVIATATGYTADTLAVPVSVNLISLPNTLNVPLSQNVSLPINLSVAAPAGGLKVAIASSNPATVQVLTDTVTVPGGSQVANATVTGVALGSATLTATNPNYAPDVSTATVTAGLNITTGTVTPNASFGSPVVVQLESASLPVAAPAGGVAVTMTSRNPSCAVAPNTTIPAGQINVAVLVTYGGVATLPCTTYLVASGPAGFTVDSVLVNMQVKPALTIQPSVLGSGLQRVFGGSTGASNHGGVTVRVTSTDPSLFLIASNDSTVGSAFVDIPIPVSGSGFNYYVQALDGVIADTADIIVSAPGFVSDTVMTRIYQGVFDIIFLTATGNTRSANDPFQVRTGSPSTPTGGLAVEDELRAGRAPLTVTIINDSIAVGDLVTTARTGDTVSVQVAPRAARSPVNVATGGVEFDYTAGGVTTVRASAPGFRAVASAISQAVTVSAPFVTLSANVIGARLQRAVSGSMSATAVAGDTVTLKTTQPGILKISPNDSTGFADSIRIALGVGQNSFTYYIQGVDSIVADTVNVIATIPGFTPDTASMRVYTPVFDIIFLNATGNTRSVNDPFQLRIGTPSSPTSGIAVEDVLRFGSAPLTFSVLNDSALVANLITQALTGDSVTVQLVARQSRSPSTALTGGVELDYTAGGVTTVRGVSYDGFRAVGPAIAQNVTVSAPFISLSGTFIGAMLQRQHSVSLSAVGVAGDTVTLKTTKPGVMRISPNDSTGFADSIRIAVGIGSSSVPFFIQGVDAVVADTTDVIATMPAFTADTARFTVYRPVFDIIFLNASANALAASDPFQVRTGSAASPTGGLSAEDELRFGLSLTATLNTSASTVAQLVTTAATGSSVTVPIAQRAARSPASVATGGVELDYLTTGTTVVTASLPGFRTLASDTVTVTVTAPFATVPATTVGSGLQEATSGSLSSSNHGGITVVVKSSSPSLMRVSPNATTAGTDSIFVAVPAGSASFSYYVQGVEGVTGAPQQVTIRAIAPGFTDGTATVTVAQPAVDVIFLAASGGAAASADDQFQVRLGWANSPTNTGMQVEQEVRAGAPGPLTVTIQSTDSAAGRIKTLAQPAGAGTVTVSIPIGQSRSASGGPAVANGLSFDFVAQGTTFIVPAIPGYVTVLQSAPPQPGFRVTIGP